jgi:hypothetical protein
MKIVLTVLLIIFSLAIVYTLCISIPMAIYYITLILSLPFRLLNSIIQCNHTDSSAQTDKKS